MTNPPRQFRIIGIIVDPDLCTCTTLCISECPEVLELDPATQLPRIRPGAEGLLNQHYDALIDIERVCPTDAIHAKKEPL